MRSAEITRLASEFPVRVLRRMLEVSPAGFYGYQQCATPWRVIMDEVLMAQVWIAFRDSGGTDGASSIERGLRAEGRESSTKHVARLMREEGLVARLKGRGEGGRPTPCTTARERRNPTTNCAAVPLFQFRTGRAGGRYPTICNRTTGSRSTAAAPSGGRRVGT